MLEKTEESIKNGKSSRNLQHWVHKTQGLRQMKQKNTVQKTKNKSNTNPTKNRR
jgi:hypothetical protein